MTNSQQMNDYYMACIYGEALLTILNVDKIPTRKLPVNKNNTSEELISWQNLYREFLMLTVGKIKTIIIKVREEYKQDSGIPQVAMGQ